MVTKDLVTCAINRLSEQEQAEAQQPATAEEQLEEQQAVHQEMSNKASTTEDNEEVPELIPQEDEESEVEVDDDTEASTYVPERDKLLESRSQSGMLFC